MAILIRRDPLAGLGQIGFGISQGLEKRGRRQSLLEAAQGFGGNAQLAQMLQGLPLPQAEQVFSQAISNQQLARIRAQQPLNALQQSQRQLNIARAQQLQQPQTLNALQEAQRQLALKRAEVLDRPEAADITKATFWKERGFGADSVKMSQDAARIKAGLKPRASSETNLDMLRKDLAAWQNIQIGTRDKWFGKIIPGEEETLKVASNMVEEIRNRIVALGAKAEADAKQATIATKYGLTTQQMKEETSGRNGGPTDRLLMRYTGFLRSLKDPADVDIAEQLRTSGVPVQTIMKRAKPQK
ncbi:hypothetical protein LCGC14_1549660 [marine sediment metagenome]|uniref:Uncharacterized protein n=1 Tax=marine sediment metagenome TaxID=412755 RepID=A0A0F9JBP4_9ZZZZ